MKTKISLRELNINGQLIEMCKKVRFVCASDRRPYFYYDRPTTCYIHYYNDMYVVTQHILSSEQVSYYKFSDAQRKFEEFVSLIED